MPQITRIGEAIRAKLNTRTWDYLAGDWYLTNGAGTVRDTSSPYNRAVWVHRKVAGDIRDVQSAVLTGNDILWEENSAYTANPQKIAVGYPAKSRILSVEGIAGEVGNAIQGNYSQIEQKIQNITTLAFSRYWYVYFTLAVATYNEYLVSGNLVMAPGGALVIAQGARTVVIPGVIAS